MPTNGTLKADVRSLLRYGKEKARTGKELARILGFKNDRAVRLVIRDMITEGIPVASTTISPGGYFIANSIDEATDYMKDLRGRLVNDAYRRRDFKLAARGVLQPHQLGLL